MKKNLSIFLLLLLLFLPAGLMVGYSYFGSSYPIENKEIRTPVFLNTISHDLTIVFFGYVGCSSVCPKSLIKIEKVLSSLGKEYPKKSVGAVFVDVRRQTDSLSVKKFGSPFLHRIRGSSLLRRDRQKVISDFALQVNPGDKQLPLLHTDHFFILEKKERWRILRVLANSTTASQIKQVLRQNLN